MTEIAHKLKPVIRKLIRDGYKKKQIEYFIMSMTREIFKELDKKLVIRKTTDLGSYDNRVSFVDPPCDTEINYS